MYASHHSFLGAPLVHRDFAEEATSALFAELIRRRWRAAGLVIPNIDPAGGLMASLREAGRSQGLVVQTTLQRERATMRPVEAGLDSLKKTMQKKYNDLERRRRRLAEQGELQWLIHRDVVGEDIVESFLRLEHSGWKAQSRTSLRSQPADEAFFRETVMGFAREGRALFTEVRLNGETIASTSNFVSGKAGFAFKVGWDEAYRKYSVGILNEAELVSHAPETCADLNAFDSGSAPDSYIESLWPGRRTLVTAFLPFSAAGQIAWRGMQSLRTARRAMHSLSNKRSLVPQTVLEGIKRCRE
jgi:Acetyltransferase (GNAT) domain